MFTLILALVMVCATVLGAISGSVAAKCATVATSSSPTMFVCCLVLDRH